MLYQSATVALLASMMPLASAHYFFDKLVLPNGQASSDYVRQNTRSTKYMPTKWINTFDNLTPDSTDFRCNLGATNQGAKGTAKVKPGDSLAMTLGVGATMRHPGPAQVYMSKAPTTAAAYDGSGGWFKIHQETICKQGANIKEEAWCTWDKDRVSFKIPSGIPDGEYLVRAEHIGLHGAHGGQAEFYYACAQVSVSGGSGSIPTNTVKIPGVYNKGDAAVNFSVWGGNNVVYPAQGPGPAVFNAGGSSPASSPSGNAPASSPSPSSGNAPASSPAPQSGNAPQQGNTPQQGNAPQGGNSQGGNKNNGQGNGTAKPAEQQQPADQQPADGGCSNTYERRHARDMMN